MIRAMVGGTFVCVGAMLVLAAGTAGSVTAAPSSGLTVCRKVSPVTVAAVRKGVVAGQQLRGRGFVVASGVKTMPWLVAVRFSNGGVGVWVTNLPPTGSPAPKHEAIRSADSAAAQWSKWPGYPTDPPQYTNHAQFNRVLAAMGCAYRG
jgi:hypothetical protein